LCKHLDFQEKRKCAQIEGQTKIFAQSAGNDFNIPLETLILGVVGISRHQDGTLPRDLDP